MHCFTLNNMELKDNHFQMIIQNRGEIKNQATVGKTFNAKSNLSN